MQQRATLNFLKTGKIDCIFKKTENHLKFVLNQLEKVFLLFCTAILPLRKIGQNQDFESSLRMILHKSGS
ncbi:hypothetical protein PPYC1_24480 [Paenibacillus polymyxa]|nr:hypothetical protein PPYC1_24480 [Paenibacillus polymyxa]